MSDAALLDAMSGRGLSLICNSMGGWIILALHEKGKKTDEVARVYRSMTAREALTAYLGNVPA